MRMILLEFYSILTTGNVSTGTLGVNKVSVQNISGIRKLFKEN